METAAMLFPEVSFSLVDRAKEREPNGGRIWVAKKVGICWPSLRASEGAILTKVDRWQTSSIISRFSDLHGATLVQSVTPLETWERPDSIHHQGEMRIDGFISLHGAHTRVSMSRPALGPAAPSAKLTFDRPLASCRRISTFVSHAPVLSNGARLISTGRVLSSNASDVNRHPLAWCDLHRTIETRFDRSGFARAVSRESTPP